MESYFGNFIRFNTCVVVACESWDYGHAHTHCYLKTKVPKMVEGRHHDHVYTGFGCGGDYHTSPSPVSSFK